MTDLPSERVERLAEEYALKNHPGQPSDAIEAQTWYEEALLAACIEVYGHKYALRKIIKESEGHE